MAITFKSVLTSGGTSLIIQISTTSESLYGQTITISKSGSTVGTTTFDNTGNAEYTVDEAGTYTVSATVSGTTYSDTVEVTDTFEASIEAGFNYHTWLVEGDVSDTYSSLNEVLADEEAVRKLMTIHDAVDYLAGFTSDDASVVTILNNDLAAKWISLTDYAMDVLEAAYSTLMGTIGKYGYGEWASQGAVPKMTSATAPYGEAYFSSGNANLPAWQAFDGDDTSYTSFTNAVDEYIGYEFPSAVVVTSLCIHGDVTSGTEFYIEGADSKAGSYTVLGEFTGMGAMKTVNFTNTTAYRSYRLRIKTKAETWNRISVYTIQFYAYSAKGAVPIMTSNTAPYGTADRKDKYSGEAYNAFDGNDGSAWIAADSSLNSWIQYKFTSPVIVKRIYVVAQDIVNRAWVGELKGSNDGTNFTSLKTNIDRRTVKSGYEEIDNDTAYLYYRLDVNAVTYGGGVSTLQFYGRELKVSAPTMTGNTSPYGEVGASGYYGSDSRFVPWHAFDGVNASDGWLPNVWNDYVYYHFTSPKIVKQISAYYYDPQNRAIRNTIQVIVSNDGSTWINLGSEYTMSGANVTDFVSFDNDTAYEYYGVKATGSASGHSIGNGNGWEFQFFGKDYSEREWDTEHPRHYIYDHGVELETLTADGYTASGFTITMPTKEPSQLYFPAVGSSQMKLAGIDAAIDMTPYTIERICVGDKMTADSSNSGSIMVATTKANSMATAYCLTYLNLVPSLSYPNQIGVDVSSVNQSVFTNIMSGYSTRSVTVTEWWLE